MAQPTNSTPKNEVSFQVKPRKKPTWIAPEVIQTSAMDCGPASLKSLLEGFGVPISYGRLREACQTDVDGTSIDTMEEIAVQLGLQAEQTVIPVDHVLLPQSRALPAIAVIRQPNGTTHFLVAWRKVGSLVQVMDPATGRRWMRPEKFLEELYIHQAPVPAAAWREWAGGEEFSGCLRARMVHLTQDKARTKQLIEKALEDPGWKVIAALDAATRMVEAIVEADGLDRGKQAAKVLEGFWVQTVQDGKAVPDEYWSVRLGPPDEDGEEQILLRGAVVVRILGPRSEEGVEVATSIDTGVDTQESEEEEAEPEKPPLSPELERALKEPPSRPWREMFSFLRQDGFLAPTVLLGALFASSIGLTIEALLLRGFLDVSAKLQLPEQRIGAMGIFLLFALALLLLEIPLSLGFLRLGRRLETRLRIAFLEKLPKLGDRYFRSRLTSDMTERIHSVYQLKAFPQLGSSLLRSSFELILTSAGLIWLDPRSTPLVFLVAAISLVMPVITQKLLTERDLKVRSHGGAISRFYLDALLGLVAVRTHGAERALRREHEGLLVEWNQSSISRLKMSLALEAVQAVLTLGLSALLLMEHLGRGGQIGGALLLFYWSLSLPTLGQEVTQIARQYPMYRNVTLRLLEPLGAPEEAENDALAIQDAQKSAPEDEQEGTSTLPEDFARFDSGAFRNVFAALGDEASRIKSASGISTVSSSSKTRFKAVKNLPHPSEAKPTEALPSNQNLSAIPIPEGELLQATLAAKQEERPEPPASLGGFSALRPPGAPATSGETQPLKPPKENPAAPVIVAPSEPTDVGAQKTEVTGVSIRMKNVTVRAGGHTILEGINLSIAPKSHIAVVGSSGAGKSSLVGLLLGWFKPSAGRVFVDGELLIGARLEKLRQETAWVDPAVQLWNRSILDNLCYGTQVAPSIPIGQVLEQADLRQVLERFPAGLKTTLGENGALVSGGEGQRVRFGRALLRPDVRLAILDEPFRGLDREKRRELMTKARLYWSLSTLICITHDVGETRAFERVLVIEGGKIVEDGVPEALASQPASRYRALLDAEEEVRHKLWASNNWRKIRIAQGKLTEVSAGKAGGKP